MAKFDYLHTNKHELLGLNGVWVVETANECPGAVAEYVVAFEAGAHSKKSVYRVHSQVIQPDTASNCSKAQVLG